MLVKEAGQRSWISSASVTPLTTYTKLCELGEYERKGKRGRERGVGGRERGGREKGEGERERGRGKEEKKRGTDRGE